MRKNVYVVYDKLAERWNDPMFAISDSASETDKMLQVSVVRDLRNHDGYAYKNADDLDLYHLGVYDDVTGNFELLEPKRLVFHYSSLKGE